MNDFDLEEVLGPCTVIGSDLLPHQLGAEAEGQPLSKRFVLAKGHYLEEMRRWIRAGESIESYISGCHREIQSELRELAKSEGLL